jgi:hypothetical protein
LNEKDFEAFTTTNLWLQLNEKDFEAFTTTNL